jgi:hypothetical protein
MESVLSSHAEHAVWCYLDPHEQARLTGILSRLSSPYVNERATAGLLASAFVAKHNLMWFDMTTFLVPINRASTALVGVFPRQDRRRGGGMNWRGYCRRRRVHAGQMLNLFA